MAEEAKKRKPLGPYNQYLSQPEAKIPRSTLKDWPRNALPSISSSNLTTHIANRDINSTVTDDTPTECFSSACRSNEGEVDLDFLEALSNESEENGLRRKENIELEVEQFHVNNRSSCNDLFEAQEYFAENTSDDEQDEEILLHPNAASVQENVNNNTSANTPLYDGAQITVAVSMLLIITFAIRHSLSGVALVDLLSLISIHCAIPNNCASSLSLLKKFFVKLKNPVQFHYYCKFCLEYQGLSIPDDKVCKKQE